MTRYDSAKYIRCDAIGCQETHPIEHGAMTEPGFRFGKWLGWLYLDLNRPDLYPRPLRFCSVFCLRWWLDQNTISEAIRHEETLREHLRATRGS